MLIDKIIIFVGSRSEADGADGGGVPSQDLRQRAHLSHQLHLHQLGRRNLLVSRRSKVT